MTVICSFPINTNNSAQLPNNECDIIIFQNGDEIFVKVFEITPDLIKYRHCKHEDGPLISVSKKDVFMIKYENGEKLVLQKFSKNQLELPSGKVVGLVIIVVFLLFLFVAHIREMTLHQSP